jgi:decaprenylphospho-beta-D-erythro-pentofuranosid-2-ulose 2-reductase
MNEYQRILVLGGKSDLALSILQSLPLARDAEIFLCGREMYKFNSPMGLSQFKIHVLELDFLDLKKSQQVIDEIFNVANFDLAILAYAILGNESNQLSQDLFKEVLKVNFYSQALLLNQINSRMLYQSHGQILQISSVAGIRPRRRNFVYGVSKSGIDFLCQGLQKHNVNSTVFITILRPGFVHSKMTLGLSPAPFATSLERVARLTADALRKRKRIVYVPKKLKYVMFVLKLLPERIFRIIDK